MSNMYAFKASTITALADAMRAKTGSYSVLDEKPEPLVTINFDISADTAEYKQEGSTEHRYYDYVIDTKELLGDMFTDSAYLYIDMEYETNTSGAFYLMLFRRDDSNNAEEWTYNPILNDYETNAPGGTHTGYYGLTDIKTKKYMIFRVRVYGFYLSNGGTYKATVNVYPCNADKKYLKNNKYTVAGITEKLNSIDIPTLEPIVLTGDGGYQCAGSVGGAYIKNFGSTITTKDITALNYMFYGSTVERIPFEINCKSGSLIGARNAFAKCSKLIEAPVINNFRPDSIQYMFSQCSRLRYIPDDYGTNWDWSYINNYTAGYMNNLFENCNSLRKIPDYFLSHLWGIQNSASYSPYRYTFCYCYALDEIRNMPIQQANLTSNTMTGFVNGCGRLKAFTFATNADGSPKIATWKSQVLDLSSVGFGNYVGEFTNYNSGITADKEVNSDAKYQALKNDPDWFTIAVAYSRYNHDSAVETINSLPDCSATGTNTIKFKGAAGSSTDGGAINTLTEAEIAVAAAKGWTVSLS